MFGFEPVNFAANANRNDKDKRTNFHKGILFEQHSRTFMPLHPTPDDQISVLAYFRGMPVAGHGKFSVGFLFFRQSKMANLIDS